MKDLTSLLNAHPDHFAALLTNAPEYRLQVLISEVREEHGKPVLVRHGYRVGAEYFYPASTVKLCGAVAALQELERLQA
ncbi:MAG: hypothetical protein EPO07_20395, partial [Verrucomicrobia bacterium]